jgi:hypothetical protein
LPGFFTAIAGLIGAVAVLLQIPQVRDAIWPPPPATVEQSKPAPPAEVEQPNQKPTPPPEVEQPNQKPDKSTPPLVGSVTDPIGDAGNEPYPEPGLLSPDLVSAKAEVTGDVLNLSVRFAPGTFNTRTTMVDVFLDTDQNPFTGSLGVDGVDDTRLIGADYIVRS